MVGVAKALKLTTIAMAVDVEQNGQQPDVRLASPPPSPLPLSFFHLHNRAAGSPGS
jgi:hypothetical protein